ncbi:MAG: nitroreductase [Minwuia sp.]|uniref:nitroreductase family protein n=1 Tax=Minwuia sp. TaxID=2493630 RepID=UPI003A8B09B2
MSAYDLVAKRASIGPKLQTGDDVSDAELEKLYEAAMTAPDHGNLNPFRFTVIRGAAREKLGDVFAEAALKRGEDQAAADIARTKPMRSPVLIAVIATVTPDHPKAPPIEQVLTAGMAGYNMVLAAQATGLAAIWLSGPPAYDAHVLASLGVGENEQLLGFVYVGRPKRDVSGPRRADWRKHVSEWTG